MSYIPIARKYRPQRFSEVIGQDVAVKTLENAITLDRLHHAYLFCGIRGVGKTSLARILAKSLNCAEGPTRSPCGVCENCRDIAQGISLDVLEIDGASNTGVDDIRALKEQVTYLPQKGKYKIYIIDEVHMLSTSAFNALLKVLEEPPPHVLFCFATTEVHKIPLTVLSRCQCFELRRIPFAEIAVRLRAVCAAEGVGCDDEAVAQIARLADGSLRDSLSLLDQAIGLSQGKLTRDFLDAWLGFSDRELLRHLLEAVITGGESDVLGQLQALHQTSLDPERLLADFIELVRYLILVKAGLKREEAEELSADEHAFLVRLSQDAAVEELDWLFQMATRGLADLALTPLPLYTLDVLFLRFLRAKNLRGLLQPRSGQSQPGADAPQSRPAAPAKQASQQEGKPASQCNLNIQSWQGFVEGLQRDEPQIGSLVAQVKWRASPLADGGTLLSLYPGEQKFYAERLKDKLPRLLELVRAHFTPSIRLELAALPEADGARESVREQKHAEDGRRKAQAEKEAREHSLVKTLTDIFGATIDEVKPL